MQTQERCNYEKYLSNILKNVVLGKIRFFATSKKAFFFHLRNTRWNIDDVTDNLVSIQPELLRKGFGQKMLKEKDSKRKKITLTYVRTQKASTFIS